MRYIVIQVMQLEGINLDRHCHSVLSVLLHSILSMNLKIKYMET